MVTSWSSAVCDPLSLVTIDWLTSSPKRPAKLLTEAINEAAWSAPAFGAPTGRPDVPICVIPTSRRLWLWSRHYVEVYRPTETVTEHVGRSRPSAPLVFDRT